MEKQNNLFGVENQGKWMPPPAFAIGFYIELAPCGPVVSTRGGYSTGQPPTLAHTGKSWARGPHGPNLGVFPLVTAWESPWKPYTQMKALVEENNFKRCGVGCLLWVGNTFGKCGCACGPKGVCTPTCFKNAANPRQVAHSHCKLFSSIRAFIWV